MLKNSAPTTSSPRCGGPRGGGDLKATSIDDLFEKLRAGIERWWTPEPPRTKPVVVPEALVTPADVAPGPEAPLKRGERRADRRTREQIFFGDGDGSTERLR